ncbi:FAD-binding protein, partial [bacterium]|nr:FAD-binding protein [bacterium]
MGSSAVGLGVRTLSRPAAPGRGHGAHKAALLGVPPDRPGGGAAPAGDDAHRAVRRDDAPVRRHHGPARVHAGLPPGDRRRRLLFQGRGIPPGRAALPAARFCQGRHHGGAAEGDAVRDLIVIGAGPAGLGAGLQAAQADMDVLVLEKDRVGGRLNLARQVGNFPWHAAERPAGAAII